MDKPLVVDLNISSSPDDVVDAMSHAIFLRQRHLELANLRETDSLVSVLTTMRDRVQTLMKETPELEHTREVEPLLQFWNSVAQTGASFTPGSPEYHYASFTAIVHYQRVINQLILDADLSRFASAQTRLNALEDLCFMKLRQRQDEEAVTRNIRGLGHGAALVGQVMSVTHWLEKGEVVKQEQPLRVMVKDYLHSVEHGSLYKAHVEEKENDVIEIEKDTFESWMLENSDDDEW